MKRIIICFLTGLILIPNLAYSQHHRTIDCQTIPKRFKVGNIFYESGYIGLRTFMADIQLDNPGLHSKLTSAFIEIERKRNKVLVSYVSGGVVGTTLLVGSFTFLQDNKLKESFFQPGSPLYEPLLKRGDGTQVLLLQEQVAIF